MPAGLLTKRSAELEHFQKFKRIYQNKNWPQSNQITYTKFYDNFDNLG